MVSNDEIDQSKNQFEDLINGLITNNYGCCDNFVDWQTSIGLRNNLSYATTLGEMNSSGVGKANDFQKNTLIRGDKIKWITENSQNDHEKIFQTKIEQFINHLNATCYTAINKFESHYASYAKGSFYKRHIDQFRGDKERKFSLILYLNKDWNIEDGGMLSLYPDGADKIDIAPIEGRLVFFRSDEMEHEVHSSQTRNRLSIAGWLKSEVRNSFIK